LTIYNDFGQYWIIFEPMQDYKVRLVISKKSAYGDNFDQDFYFVILK